MLLYLLKKQSFIVQVCCVCRCFLCLAVGLKVWISNRVVLTIAIIFAGCLTVNPKVNESLCLQQGFNFSGVCLDSEKTVLYIVQQVHFQELF